MRARIRTSTVISVYWLWGLLGLLLAGGMDTQLAAQSIELEISMSAGAPITAAQEWLEALEPLNLAHLQMRNGGGEVKPEVRRELAKSGREERLVVLGVINGDGELQLPGGKFSLQQTARLRSWLEETATAPARQAAGRQAAAAAEAWQERLSSPVNESTKGKKWGDVWQQLQREHRLTLELEPRGARRSGDAGVNKRPATRRRSGTRPEGAAGTAADGSAGLGGAALQAVDLESQVPDEFQGLSHGTALAYLLHLRGFVLLKPQGEPPAETEMARLSFAPASVGEEPWPLGRPVPDAERKLVPSLLEFAPVEVNKTPLSTVIDALQPRLKVPVLWDHPALAAQQIVPAEVPVTIAARRTFYRQVLDQALSKGRLKFEVRVDDGGRPFGWIRPLIATAPGR